MCGAKSRGRCWMDGVHSHPGQQRAVLGSCWTCSGPKAHHRPIYQRGFTRREPTGVARDTIQSTMFFPGCSAGTPYAASVIECDKRVLCARDLLNDPRANELPMTMQSPHYFQSPLDVMLLACIYSILSSALCHASGRPVGGRCLDST